MQNCCKYCGKKFSRKIIYKRHIILCEILNNPKTKREIECEKEEEVCVPNQEQMYNIILELAFKCSKLEEKVAELQKNGFGGGGSKKSIPINVLEILNKTITPTQHFNEWTKHVDFHVVDADFEFLMEPQNIYDTLMRIVRREIDITEYKENVATSLAEYPYPFLCTTSTNKQKTFYIYTLDEEWKICPSDQYIYFVKHLHSKLFNAMCAWNVKNKKKLNDSDKLDEIYNAAYMKVTGYKFIEDCSDMNKIKTGLFQYFNIAIV